MKFFQDDLQKKFKRLFKRNLFNIFITIDYDYVRKLERENIEDIVIRVNYDEHIGICSYEIMERGIIFYKNDRNDRNFIQSVNPNTNYSDFIYLSKNEFIYYPVKTYLRKYIIKKLIDFDEDDCRL